MNRKGQYVTSKRFLSAFKTLFFIIIGMALVVYTLHTAEVDERQVQEIRYRLYAEQLLNNPACFAYEHPSGRVDYGVLDASKLDQAHLDSCFKLSSQPPVKMLPAKVTILDERSRPSALQTSTWTNTIRTTRTFKRHVQLKDQTGLYPTTIIINLNPR